MSEVKKYRKLPVVIEAFQLTGMNSDGDVLLDWNREHNGLKPPPFSFTKKSEEQAEWTVEVKTLEGDMKAHKGDWILRGVAGEFYPCADEIFKATYEAVD